MVARKHTSDPQRDPCFALTALGEASQGSELGGTIERGQPVGVCLHNAAKGVTTIQSPPELECATDCFYDEGPPAPDTRREPAGWTNPTGEAVYLYSSARSKSISTATALERPAVLPAGTVGMA